MRGEKKKKLLHRLELFRLGSWAELHRLSRRTARLRNVPNEVLLHSPDEAVALSVCQVAEALLCSKRGSVAGLSGATFEMYKLLLDDDVALDLLTGAVSRLARVSTDKAAEALAMSRLTPGCWRGSMLPFSMPPHALTSLHCKRGHVQTACRHAGGSSRIRSRRHSCVS